MDYERHKVADALEVRYFQPNERIIQQGDEGDRFFIIEEGEGKVLLANEDGHEEAVMDLHPRDYFGEIALITLEPRKASVVAETAMKTVSLDKQSFDRVIGSVVEILKRNMSNYDRAAEQYKLSSRQMEESASQVIERPESAMSNVSNAADPSMARPVSAGGNSQKSTGDRPSSAAKSAASDKSPRDRPSSAAKSASSSN